MSCTRAWACRRVLRTLHFISCEILARWPLLFLRAMCARVGALTLVSFMLARMHSQTFPRPQACANGNTECVGILLKAGAAVFGNDAGNTPLHWAVLNKHVDVVCLDLGCSHLASVECACVWILADGRVGWPCRLPCDASVPIALHAVQIMHTLNAHTHKRHLHAVCVFIAVPSFRCVCCVRLRPISTCWRPTGLARVRCQTLTGLVRLARP
jgi:hypothetical protein